MATVVLRDIVTDADRAAVLAIRLGAGQDRFVASVETSFQDAIDDARACPRMWSVNDGDRVIGFVMISDGIPPDRLASDHDLLGPYFLWRLLIDHLAQGHGYGTAALDAIFERIEDPRYGSLVASSLLFFVPTAICGAVSPYAVRLLVSSLHGSGRSAGSLYFVSTFGSAAGTLATSFYLVLLFEVDQILLGLIAVSVALGAAAVVSRGKTS